MLDTSGAAKMKMDFFRWRDMYHIARQNGSVPKSDGPKEAYQRLGFRFLRSDDFMSAKSCNAELLWYQHGNPYYKVWPAMAAALSNTKIDIDCKFLQMPFPTIEVCLPKHPSHQFREHPDAPAVTSMLVYRDDDLRGAKDNREASLMVHYQLDVDLDKPWMGWYFNMGLKSGTSIANRFELSWKKSAHFDDGYEPSKEFTEKIVKLAVAVCFFGTHNHQVIMPDIPNRLIERYHDAKQRRDKSEAEKLLQRAKDMGHFGWRVGSEIDLPQPIVKHINRDESGTTGEGNELQFGHVRSGHMRYQPYGSKDEPNHYELIFIPPTTVRPDLPLRDIRGFRISDKALERRNENH